MSDTTTHQNRTILHEELNVNDEDPYQSLRYLGHGASGSVDEVRRKGDTTQQCFARKQVVLPRGPRGNQMIEELRQEARTIQRLRHRHIIRLVTTYTRGKVFGIVMNPVAETDLQDFLSQIESIKSGKERNEVRQHLLKWPGCLLRGLDYIHEMRVKHRDIKPSNILIKGRNVYFTDFGISSVIPEGYTTGTEGPGAMTRLYAAPEALKVSARRGRAVDIFSLGCVFLEMATVLILERGSLESFCRYRAEITGSSNYAENGHSVLKHIWHIWAVALSCMRNNSFPPEWDKFFAHGACLSKLAFLMLDPNPETRITSRQLVGIISTSHHDLHSIDDTSCNKCRSTTAHEDHNLPLHSVFKDEKDIEFPDLDTPPPFTQFTSDWEIVKQKWLKHHMWW